MKLHRKTINGATNTSTDIDLAALFDDQGATQYLCDFNIEISGNSATVTLSAKGTFPDSQFVALNNGTIPINGGHYVAEKFAFSSIRATTAGSAYKIMITRQLESV